MMKSEREAYLAALRKLEEEIIARGGTWEFECLLDAQTGELVPARVVNTRWGDRWAIYPSTDTANSRASEPIALVGLGAPALLERGLLVGLQSRPARAELSAKLGVDKLFANPVPSDGRLFNADAPVRITEEPLATARTVKERTMSLRSRTTFHVIGKGGEEIRSFTQRQRALDEFQINKEAMAVVEMPAGSVIVSEEGFAIDPGVIPALTGPTKAAKAAKPKGEKAPRAAKEPQEPKGPRPLANSTCPVCEADRWPAIVDGKVVLECRVDPDHFRKEVPANTAARIGLKLAYPPYADIFGGSAVVAKKVIAQLIAGVDPETVKAEGLGGLPDAAPAAPKEAAEVEEAVLEEAVVAETEAEAVEELELPQLVDA